VCFRKREDFAKDKILTGSWLNLGFL